MVDRLPLLRSLAEASSDGMMIFNADERIVACNAAARRLTDGAEIVGKPLRDVLACLDSTAIAASDSPAPAPGGSERWTMHRIAGDDGEAAGGFCVHHAQDPWGHLERRLRESARRFRDFVESASDWFWETDSELHYIYLSERYQQATGLKPESRLGRRRGEARLNGPDDGDWDAHLADLEARRPFRDFTFAYLDAEGRRRVAQVSGRPVFEETGAFAGYCGVGRDITAAVEAQERIRFLAQHDPLTGLPNRALFKDRLRQVLLTARRKRRRVAILSIDLDDFKTVNDTLGHAAGDALLCEVAQRMRDAAREMDTVARLGGDEFTVVQTEIGDWQDAKALAGRLIARLSEPIALGEERVHCGASIGISLYPGDGETADELLRHADMALYKAKASGRNNACFFLPSMNEEVQKRRVIEQELRAALRDEHLTLFYQPQIDLHTGETSGVEVLLRWFHAEWGAMPPEIFIRIAERSGLIQGIDRWVLARACRQARDWRDEGLLPPRIAVNLSAVSLGRADLLAELVANLAENGLPPEQLEIEITESALLTDPDTVGATLAAMHALGVSLAVDDFGTGYSSLTYLRRFPVSKVKIDRAYVRTLGSNQDDAAIARAIITLGHSLNLRVVAEGVETREQLDFLYKEGCNDAQGYYLGRPMSADDFATYLRGRRFSAPSDRPLRWIRDARASSV